MKAVILCGGVGTRLREETEYRPKPMVEIGGRPILWHIMKLYAYHGIREFVLCLGYKGQVIREYFLNYHAMQNDCTVHLGSRAELTHHGTHAEEDWRVTLADTGAEKLTAERIHRIQCYVGDEPFMVTYGDGVADIDLAALLKYHRAHGRLATLTGVRDASRFGIVEADTAGMVTGFKEKPQVSEWINAGFFVFEPGIFDYLADRPVMLEKVLPDLARDGELAMCRHEGFWQCMDTYRDSLLLNDLWSAGSSPWAVWRD